jgi:hypothetical protein
VGTGRFNTADPSRGSNRGDPGSWNRYAYVQGDPINFNDAVGLNRLMCDVYTNEGTCAGGGGGGGRLEWVYVEETEDGGGYYEPIPAPPAPAPVPFPDGGGGAGDGRISQANIKGLYESWLRLEDPDCAKAIGGKFATSVEMKNSLMHVQYSVVHLKPEPGQTTIALTTGFKTELNADAFFAPTSVAGVGADGSPTTKNLLLTMANNYASKGDRRIFS